MKKKSLVWEIPKLVQSNRIGVVYVGAIQPAKMVFDVLVKNHNAATAWIASSDVVFNMITAGWLHARQRALGWPEIEFVPDGYYLFVEGELRAYEAGMIDPSRDGLSLFFGAVASLDWLLSPRRKGIQDALEVANAQASIRVISAFDDVISSVMAYEAAQQATSRPISQVRDYTMALELLCLDSSCSERDLKVRQRELMKEHHPDRFANDSNAQILATQRAQEINKAVTVISVYRGWRPG